MASSDAANLQARADMAKSQANAAQSQANASREQANASQAQQSAADQAAAINRAHDARARLEAQ